MRIVFFRPQFGALRRVLVRFLNLAFGPTNLSSDTDKQVPEKQGTNTPLPLAGVRDVTAALRFVSLSTMCNLPAPSFGRKPSSDQLSQGQAGMATQDISPTCRAWNWARRRRIEPVRELGERRGDSSRLGDGPRNPCCVRIIPPPARASACIVSKGMRRHANDQWSESDRGAA